MKKVLIITEVYPPAFNPRMGYLVKYLPEFEWDADIVTVNTLKDNNYKFLVGNNKIVRVNLKYTDTPHGIIRKTWRLLNSKRYFRNNKRPFIKEIISHFNQNEYAIILVSVSWELYILDAGMEISRRWNIPLIVDLRDIIEQKPKTINSELTIKTMMDNYFTGSFERMKIRLRDKILKKAKTVTTVSPFHVKKLSTLNNNIKLIYNGYDPDLYNYVHIEKANTFIIIYTGTVFDENEQDPSLLFEAVTRLEKNGIISNEYFRMHFYTPLKFRPNIIKNKLFPIIDKYVEFFDYVDTEEIPGLLAGSSIGLILANLSDNNGPKGVITTKLFDYLGAERPVLCVRSDEGILESLIKELNIGISARSADDAYSFILCKLNEWKEKGYTTVTVNQNCKQQFSRKNQAKQFSEVFDQTIV